MAVLPGSHVVERRQAQVVEFPQPDKQRHALTCVEFRAESIVDLLISWLTTTLINE